MVSSQAEGAEPMGVRFLDLDRDDTKWRQRLRLGGLVTAVFAVLLAIGGITRFNAASHADTVINLAPYGTVTQDGNGGLHGNCAIYDAFSNPYAIMPDGSPAWHGDWYQVVMPDGQVLWGQCLDFGRTAPAASSSISFDAVPNGNGSYTVTVNTHLGSPNAQQPTDYGALVSVSNPPQRIGYIVWSPFSLCEPRQTCSTSASVGSGGCPREYSLTQR